MMQHILIVKILKDRTFETARNCGYDEYQRALASTAHKFFDKKIKSGAIGTSKAGISVNEELSDELHKPVIKKFKRQKVYSRFIGNIWPVDLAETKSLSSKNENVKYLLFVIDFLLNIHSLNL